MNMYIAGFYCDHTNDPTITTIWPKGAILISIMMIVAGLLTYRYSTRKKYKLSKKIGLIILGIIAGAVIGYVGYLAWTAVALIFGGAKDGCI